MSMSRQLGWAAVGTVVGGGLGVVVAWFGTGGYEAGNSMIGTGIMGAMLGALLVAIVLSLLDRRRGSQRDDGADDA